MKYLKEYIDWEEDWEEEEKNKKTIDYLIENQITIDAKNLSYEERKHLTKFLIDNNVVNWENRENIDIEDFEKLGKWCFIKLFKRNQKYYIVRTDGRFYDSISVKELLKNFQ